MLTKGRYRKATFDEALKLVKLKPRARNAMAANMKMFRSKKKLWEDDEYEKTQHHASTGKLRRRKKDKPVTLPSVQFLNRRLDGET